MTFCCAAPLRVVVCAAGVPVYTNITVCTHRGAILAASHQLINALKLTPFSTHFFAKVDPKVSYRLLATLYLSAPFNFKFCKVRFTETDLEIAPCRVETAGLPALVHPLNGTEPIVKAAARGILPSQSGLIENPTFLLSIHPLSLSTDSTLLKKMREIPYLQNYSNDMNSENIFGNIEGNFSFRKF
jgi:hypothetical protein